MSFGGPADTITEAVASIEDVSLRIEDTFAQTGDHLGRGHAIFKDLNDGLSALSRELSGAELEGVSVALQGIAGRLNGLAESLPAEVALLGSLGDCAKEASSFLQPLFKHIQLITIIARSARIEAASLDRNRESFLAFTEEAFELGKSVEGSIEGCARDQKLLSAAVETALNRQKDFEKLYRTQLLSTSTQLISCDSGIRDQQNESVRFADLAGASTKKIAEAVGGAIVLLQSGDSARQRLEHVCRGLRVAGDFAPTGVQDQMNSDDEFGSRAHLVCQLQIAQLKDAHREFDRDIGQIARSLTVIHGDAADAVNRGCSLYGGSDGDGSSFLDNMKQTLARASVLIATCEGAGKSVDDALSLVEDTLAKFRRAISGLSEMVVDIILIGMNASLKAGHLGSKGNAFVVIADELKATADQVSGGVARLKPVLDRIENSASDLRESRVRGDSTQLTELEPMILNALQDVETGNERLGRLMKRLVDTGAEFDGLMGSAKGLMAVLGDATATIPAVATRLEAENATRKQLPLTATDEMTLDDLLARYTMETERVVHREFLQRFGIVSNAMNQLQDDEADGGVLLF
jgi:hypothetical protein